MSLLAGEITLGLLLRFAAPTILSFVFLNIYFVIDGIFVSRAVGTSGLAAVNLAMPLLNVMIALATMLSTGGSARIAALLGEKKTEEARKGFTFIVLSGVIFSAILTGLSFVFLEPLLGVLGADETLLALCKSYAVPLLISQTFVMGGMLLDAFFIVEGRPALSMLSGMIGGFINIALDYIFLFQWGMGIEGAAIATGIGYSFSALVGIAYFGFWRKGTLFFVRPVLCWHILKKSLSNGISEMVTMLSASIVMIAANNILMNLAGENGVAAFSIAQYAEELLLSVYIGYAEGIAPLTSYNYGERNFANIRRIFRFSLGIIGCFGLMAFVLSFFIAEPVVAAFSEGNTAVFGIAVHGFSIFAIGFLFVGFNVYASSLFTALNDGRTSAVLSFCHTMVFLLGMLILLSHFFGIDGVWFAEPAAELMAMLFGAWIVREKGKIYGLA